MAGPSGRRARWRRSSLAWPATLPPCPRRGMGHARAAPHYGRATTPRIATEGDHRARRLHRSVPEPVRRTARTRRSTPRRCASATSPSSSASSRCGRSSTTSTTTRCVPTSCSGSPTGPASTPNVLLGSGVVVLPWHDPLRVAEQIALLDNMSDGRMIFGIGRGLARIEYEGFRVDMNTSRERLVEYMQAGARRPRDRLHGVRQRVRHPAPPPDPPPAGALLQGPGLRRRRLARLDADHGRARRRRAGHPPEAVGRGASRTWPSTTGSSTR